MSRGQAGSVLRHIRRLVGAPEGAAAEDGQLLHRFAKQREEAAFADLVRRHGPLVLDVCRRVLHHEQDAADAFQATFLILARKAATVRKGTSLASWLYGVAYRVAMKARTSAARRRARELRVGREVREESPPDLALRELQAVLEAEVDRLPEKYRAPFVLCCLEGRSRAEAARELGWKEGTVSGRLDQARKRLRQRLVRRGVALTAALAGLAVADTAAPAAVPAGLAAGAGGAALFETAGKNTTGAAIPARVVALADGVSRTMFASKVKVATALIMALGLAGMGFGVFAYQAWAARQAEVTTAAAPEPAAGKADEDKSPPEAARVDRFGDPLPEGAVARLGTVRLRARCASCLAFSRDGRLLAAGNSDMTARLWHTATGREVARFHGSRLGQVCHVALSPDGSTLATLDADRAVRLWDARTGKHLRQAEELVAVDGAPWAAFAFTFSPDGQTLYAGPGGSVRAIAVADGKTAALASPPELGLSLDALSLDGTAAVSTAGGRLVVWDVRSGKALAEVAGPKGRGLLALSPGGKRLAFATAETEPAVVVWDLASGKELSRCRGHRAWISSLAFSPDGKVLASGSGDLTARLWDAESGKARWSYRAPGANFYYVVVAFGPDGKTVGVVGWDGIVRLLDADTGKDRLRTPGPLGWMGLLAVTPDGKAVFTASEDQSLRLWDVSTGEELRVLKGPALNAYDPEQQKVVHPDEWIYRLDLTPAGRALAVGGLRGVRMWDLGDPDRPRAGDLIDNSSRAALSPDGKMLVTSREKLQLLDVHTKRVLRETEGPSAGASLSFSPDGRTLAVGCPEEVVRLYIVRTLQERSVLRGGGRQAVERMVFSPDSQLLATNGMDWHVDVWEVASGQLRRRIERKESMMDALAFSPDGRHLAIAGTDRAVSVYDVAAGRIVHTFQGHDGWVSYLAFTRDGHRLISGSQDTTALVWDMSVLPSPPARDVKRTPEDLDALWERLAGGAERADAAMRELAASPSQGADMLGRSLKPAEKADAARITRWVRELDSDSFAERERASKSLEEVGEGAAEALRAALGAKPSPEVRRRAEALLNRLKGEGPSPECLRGLRAVQVLEWIGTTEARRALKAVAAGAPEARLTQEAKAALERLSRRGPHE